MLRSNVSMSRLSSPEDSLRIKMSQLRERRLMDNPPLILPSFNYVDHFMWTDQLLLNLKRHPDFRFQFLISIPIFPNDPNDRIRYDESDFVTC